MVSTTGPKVLPAAPMVLPAAGTVTGLDVELGDDRNDGRQIGLILDNDARIDECDRTVGTGTAGDVDDAIDAFGRRLSPRTTASCWRRRATSASTSASRCRRPAISRSRA